MVRGLRRLLPSPALVVASLALAVSLGGVGYAATRLPRNSVGAAQLRNNAVSSAKVKNHSQKTADFAHGVVRQGAPGAAGPQGPAGPRGATGATGPQGAPGVGIGGSCAAGSAIRAVAASGAVTCQTAATDSIDGYLTAGDHAAFAAARTYHFSFASLAHESFTTAGTVVEQSSAITIPGNLHEIFGLWEGEWKGGTSTAPSTMKCSITLDASDIVFNGATVRHSVSTGGYADIAVSTLLDATPGSHKIWVNCENDTGGASIGNANLTVIGLE
ncbi:MAG TPA: collagen-like protein [Gaiellaceae bacterium]|nr:collagen-like protein [Gaiellaceae bacterium]